MEFEANQITDELINLRWKEFCAADAEVEKLSLELRKLEDEKSDWLYKLASMATLMKDGTLREFTSVKEDMERARQQVIDVSRRIEDAAELGTYESIRF